MKTVRLVPLLIVLTVAAPAFAQQTQAQRDADRAMQDSIRQAQQYQQQQQQDALAARVQTLEDQRRSDDNLRALQSQVPGPASPPVLAPVGPPLYALQGSRPLPITSDQADVATAATPQAQAAANAYAACLTEAARGLDDHISDAATIAAAIEPSCQTQFQAWKGLLDQGAAGQVRLVLDESIGVSQHNTAVQAVLKARQAPPRASR